MRGAVMTKRHGSGLSIPGDRQRAADDVPPLGAGGTSFATGRRWSGSVDGPGPSPGGSSAPRSRGRHRVRSFLGGYGAVWPWIPSTLRSRPQVPRRHRVDGPSPEIVAMVGKAVPHRFPPTLAVSRQVGRLQTAKASKAGARGSRRTDTGSAVLSSRRRQRVRVCRVGAPRRR